MVFSDTLKFYRCPFFDCRNALTNYQLIVIISIDSTNVSEVNLIQISVHSDKKDVKAFLEKLNMVVNNKKFNIDSDLIIIQSRKNSDKEQFSTPFTLVDLEYDCFDILDRLKELTIENYSETKIDRDNDNPPLLYVFGMYIEEKLVYIKIKLKGDNQKRVLCLSFHYAEKQMEFPYA